MSACFATRVRLLDSLLHNWIFHNGFVPYKRVLSLNRCKDSSQPHTLRVQSPSYATLPSPFPLPPAMPLTPLTTLVLPSPHPFLCSPFLLHFPHPCYASVPSPIPFPPVLLSRPTPSFRTSLIPCCLPRTPFYPTSPTLPILSPPYNPSPLSIPLLRLPPTPLFQSPLLLLPFPSPRRFPLLTHPHSYLTASISF